jgi:hypothetical protein
MERSTPSDVTPQCWPSNAYGARPTGCGRTCDGPPRIVVPPLPAMAFILARGEAPPDCPHGPEAEQVAGMLTVQVNLFRPRIFFFRRLSMFAQVLIFESTRTGGPHRR